MTHSRRSEGRYPYPFVECNHHPGPQEGYGICIHVMGGAAVGYFEHASETEIGIISCELPAESHGPKDLVLACAGCAMAHHAAAIDEWLRKGIDTEERN